MARFKVVDLEELKALNPEEGAEYDHASYIEDPRDYLYDTDTGKVIFVDGGEPEDATLGRDLHVFVDLLNEAYPD